MLGGTVLTINGPFLYTDSKVPADIEIAGYILLFSIFVCIHSYITKNMILKENHAAF